MAYKVITIDPRPAQKDAMIALLNANQPVVGIEFTLLDLSHLLADNIDGQHIGGDVNKAAVELALHCALPNPNTTLAIVRPDADALATVALLNLRAEKEQFTQELTDRVEMIAKYDTFANGSWPGVRPVSLDEDALLFKALGVISSNFTLPVEQRITAFQQFLLTGTCDALPTAIETVRQAFEHAATQSNVTVLIPGKLAYIESNLLAATEIGYHYAPVLVIKNPVFRFNGGDAHTKYTICSFEDALVDFAGLKKALNTEETAGTWGGGKKILGSPQGVSPNVTMGRVIELVEQHLI